MLTIISCLPCGTSDFQVSLLPQAAPAGWALIHTAHHAKPQRSKRRMGGGTPGKEENEEPCAPTPPKPDSILTRFGFFQVPAFASSIGSTADALGLLQLLNSYSPFET